MKQENKFNKLKFEERLKTEVSETLRRSFNDPRLVFVSITHVELNNDYSVAKIYWDSFKVEEKDEIAQALAGIESKFRSLLAKTLKVRHTPHINFIYNSQFEDENKILELLKNG